MKKPWVRFGLIFALTLIFLYFFFRSVEWKEVFRHLAKTDLLLFVLTILMVPLHLATRAYRWKYLLLPEKKGVKFFNMFAANAVGFTVTLIFPGRLGELVKPLYLARKEGLRKGFVLGTVVVERTFDMFTMCALLGIFLLARPLYASHFQANQETLANLHRWGIIGLSFASLLLVLSLSLYFFKDKALKVVSFFLKPFPEKLSRKILELFHEFVQGLKFFHSLGNLLRYTFFSFVVWLGLIFFYWVFFFVYKISLPYFAVVPYVFLTMIGASIPTPGMVGGFHYFSKVGMTSLYSIDLNLAVGMTIVVHALQLVMTCLIGYIILWREGLTLMQLRKLGENNKP